MGRDRTRETSHDPVVAADTAVAKTAVAPDPAGPGSRAVSAMHGSLGNQGVLRYYAGHGRRQGSLGSATAAVAGPGSSLPHQARIQASFGHHDVSGIRSHVGGEAGATARSLGTQAYSVGQGVAFSEAPSLHVAAHEAAHAMQRNDGFQAHGGVGQPGDAYERHADAVADKVVAGQSAEALLDQMAGPRSGPAAVRAYEGGVCYEDAIETRVISEKAAVRRHALSVADVIGELSEGAAVSVTGREGSWLTIEYQGQTGYVRRADVGDLGAFDPGGTCVEGEEPGETTDPNAARRLATDFNQVPVWNPDEAYPAQQPAVHYRTPYLLNTVDQDASAGGIKALTIAEGRLHAGQTVRDAVGNRPFVGKGTPEQMHVIAQAIVDNRHDGQTPATIQAYAESGRARTSSRRNGKWGVDCSGFTSQLMHELEGNGREGYSSTNAASYAHDGSRGYTAVNPADTRSGDVIQFTDARHVVVIHDNTSVDLPRAGGGTETRRAHKLSISESGAKGHQRDGLEVGEVRSNRRFYYFPDATQVMGRENLAGPVYRLGGIFSEELPRWQPELTGVSYGGGTTWSADFTLNCASDSNGTNVRVREEDGRFVSTSTLIPNGAAGVELREVEDGMVRIRYNGTDLQDGKTMWAPVAYVATTGAAYSIPRGGQPAGLSAGRYSVVRNPNLEASAEQQADGEGAQESDGG